MFRVNSHFIYSNCFLCLNVVSSFCVISFKNLFYVVSLKCRFIVCIKICPCQIWVMFKFLFVLNFVRIQMVFVSNLFVFKNRSCLKIIRINIVSYFISWLVFVLFILYLYFLFYFVCYFYLLFWVYLVHFWLGLFWAQFTSSVNLCISPI